MGRAIRKIGAVCLAALAAGPAGAQALDGPDALWSPEVYDLGGSWTTPGPALGPEDAGTLAQREDLARQQAAAAEAEIRKVLAGQINLPAPPALDLSCQSKDAAPDPVEAWVRAATEPEATLLEQLHAARRELQLLGLDAGEAYELESQVAHRVGENARAVMAANRKAPGAIPAVVGLVRRASAMEGALGNTAESESLLAELGPWLAPFLPDMLTALREQHDYSKVEAALRLVRGMNSLGLETGTADLDSVLAQIEAAMQFQLTVDYTFTVTGANGSYESYHLQAEVPLKYRVGGADKDARAMLVGEGTGSYLSYIESDGDLQMQAPGFAVGAKVEKFDPCAGTATLFMDRLYAEAETYIYPDGPPTELNMAEVSFMVLWEDHNQNGGWVFVLPVTNRAVMAIDVPISETLNEFAGTMQFTLEHRPK